jgi:cAMP-dependent protein kinase regulator
MIDFLQKKGGYSTSGLTINEQNELQELRKEIKKYHDLEKAILEAENEENEENENEENENEENENEEKEENENEENENSEEENNSNKSQSEEEEDEIMNEEELRKKQQRKGKSKRAGVSAEAYGEFNKKEDFIPRVIEKTEEQKNKIKKRIISSFLFSNLDQKELEIVINAMDEKKYKPNENVITQGESGDCLYVVEEGNLDCTKHFTEDGEEKYLKTYIPGESFGELALLYNAPRAATIKAKTDCILWVLDRETFNNIVKDSAQKKREKYENFLKNVDILSTIDSYELTQICDALKSEVYNKGDLIIREGESGNVFYILEEGEAIATKAFDGGEVKEIKRYGPGEYFGERALIKGEPRFCNIEVVSDSCKIISLDRDSFKRLLGPIEPLLLRNIEKYKKFVKE